jgi:hypothetical protein
MNRDLLLWTTIIGGPAIWMLSFGALFSLVTWACSFHWKPALYVITLISLLLTTGLGWLAWAEWRKLGVVWPDQHGNVVVRARMLAISGVLLNAAASLLILWQGIVEIILGACE